MNMKLTNSAPLSCF